MKVTELDPKKVFYYFSEISKIPHGSGNTENLAVYCINFAKEHGLKSYRDQYGNLMIFKDASEGHEHSEPVIIQGHLDMVCEKLSACKYDMEREGIKLITDGKYIWADGTTLGGDDGIAVAYILALLSSEDITHPPIEALLTLDEEIGLRGANALDASYLKGRRLINIDSEEEGIFTVSCAGGIRAQCELPVRLTAVDECEMCAKRIEIGGLLGGHSGIDINKSRKNAAKVLAELMYELNNKMKINIADFCSGGRPNVIPRTAEAVVCVNKNSLDIFNMAMESFIDELKKSCAFTEPDVYVKAEDTSMPEFYTDRESTDKLVFSLMQMIDGVCNMNPDIPTLVQTSSNIGSVSMENRLFKMGLMIRSNTASGKKGILRRVESLMKYIGGTMYYEDDYPAWEYRHNSPLREIMTEAYREMYGELPEICAIHAGLECGILAKKIPGVDMISIGPDMENVHTPEERLSIESVKRCWNFLLRVLERLS